MITLIIGLLLAGLLLLCISLLKTYSEVPLKELKRQARQGDELASVLYRVASYGTSMRILLWLFIGLSGTMFFVFLGHNFPWLVAIFGSLAVIWFGFAWMPNTPVSRSARWIAKGATPVIHWLLDKLYPLLQRVERFVARHRPITVHTGVYTKQDLLDLLRQQKVQIDNRIDKEELRIASHALTFGDKKVGDVMTPRRVMKTASAHDLIGPVLMGELHDSGHSRFPVTEGDTDTIVGMLYMRDAVNAKAGGRVKDIMDKRAVYVNEDSSLVGVLQAFIRTHQHLFIVVNSFEEIVGLVTMEDVLEQILGRQIIDEFDQYDDLRAVAELEAKKQREENKTVVEETTKETDSDEQSSTKQTDSEQAKKAK